MLLLLHLPLKLSFTKLCPPIANKNRGLISNRTQKKEDVNQRKKYIRMNRLKRILESEKLKKLITILL